MALGQASVEILPDLSKFVTQLEKGVNSVMAEVTQSAEKAGEQVESAFQEASRSVTESLGDISQGDPFAGVERDAEMAGEAVESSFREAARQSESAINGISGRIGGLMTALAAAGAGAAVAAGFKFAIGEASNLGESINAVNVTFGESAAGITKLAEEASTALGLTQNDFNSLAVRFSSFATTISGPGGDVVATMDEMTTRAADFASVMNLDVAQAAELFQSGLAGETEPLKRYGLDLSAAAVENYALAAGIATAGQEMTEAQKVQARYGLLMEQTSKTQGDFANTSDSLANATRIFKAEIRDAAAEIGAAMLPALQGVMQGLNEVLPAIKGPMKQVGEAMGDTIGVIADAFVPVLPMLGEALATVLTDVGSIFESLAPLIKPLVRIFTEIATIVSGVLATAFEALAPAIEVIGKFLNQLGKAIGPVVKQVFQELAPILTQIGDVLAGALATILPTIVDLFKQMAPVIGQILTVFADLASTVLTALIPPLAQLVSEVLAALGPMLPQLADAFLQILDALMPLLPPLLELVTTLLPPLTDLLVAVIPLVAEVAKLFAGALAGAINMAMPVIQAVIGVIQRVVDVVADVVEWLSRAATSLTGWIKDWKGTLKAIGDALSSALPAVLDWFRQLPGKILSSLGNLAQTLWGKAKDLIGGLLTGIQNAWESVRDWLGNVAMKVLRAIGNLGETLYDKGRDIIIGLWDGMKRIWETVTGWLGSFGQRILRGLGNIGDVLVEIGKAIINGLWEGMKSAWKNVSGWLGGVGGWIVDLKGPPAKDKILLYRNGQLIMRGLEDGMKDGFRGVRALLKQVTTEIADSVVLDPTRRKIPMPTAADLPELTPEQTQRIFDDLNLAERKLTLGEIDIAAYEKTLMDAISNFAVYSDEYMRIYDQIVRIQDDNARRQMDAAALEFEIIKNRFEATGKGGEAYLAALKRQQTEYVKWSDEWVGIQSEINSLRNASVESMYDEAEAARDVADAIDSQREARRRFKSTIKEGSEADDEERRAAGSAYAQSIYEMLQAKAAKKGIPDRSVRWARFMRRRLEKAIAAMQKDGFTYVVDGLKRILLGIPNIEPVEQDESDPTQIVGPVAPPSLRPVTPGPGIPMPGDPTRVAGIGAGLVNIENATFQDATDADLVAHRVMAALSIRSMS